MSPTRRKDIKKYARSGFFLYHHQSNYVCDKNNTIKINYDFIVTSAFLFT